VLMRWLVVVATTKSLYICGRIDHEPGLRYNGQSRQCVLCRGESSRSAPNLITHTHAQRKQTMLSSLVSETLYRPGLLHRAVVTFALRLTYYKQGLGHHWPLPDQQSINVLLDHHQKCNFNK